MSAKLLRNFTLEDHGIRKMRIGDLNNDGLPELVFAQFYPMNREICGVTAVDLDGNVLWNHGTLLEECNWAYSDVPIQVVDWDGDGRNEVLYIRQAYYKTAHMWCYSKIGYVDMEDPTRYQLRQEPDLATESALEYEGDATLVILDGATGQVKKELPMPAPADDCIAFGHFDGTGKLNILVKDRYWNIWALDNDGQSLWHITDKQLKTGLGHYPAVGDVDGDGLDEVFLTDTLINSDGSILWRIPNVPNHHHDSAYIIDTIPEPRIVSGGDQVRMIKPDGEVVWAKDGGHLQVVFPGKFSTDPKHGPYQFLVWDQCPNAANYQDGCDLLNHGKPAGGQKTVIYDWSGNEIWSRRTENQPGFFAINWTGITDDIAWNLEPGVFRIQDIHGNEIETVRFVGADGAPSGEDCSLYSADLWGDSRDEMILYTNTRVNIFTNTALNNTRRHYNASGFNGPILR